jgi:hypothetical protein
MNKLLYIFFVILLAGLTFAQPKEILLNWECDMEIELLSGRFVAGDTVAARGNFNSWGRYDLIPDPGDPNFYISENPFVDTLDVGDTIFYKFFYTPNSWEGGSDRGFGITQDIYDDGEAFISRAFNDGTLETVTNQETTVLFTVDTDGAVSSISGNPFPVVNTVHAAGGTPPLQWPGGGWPHSDSTLMIKMYDDGTHGDITADDDIFSAEVMFPAFTPFQVFYKYGINYGDDVNNEGGNDNEAGVGDNHEITLSKFLQWAQVDNVFGTMGLHTFTTDVRDVTDVMPTAYSLEQNYPNPFNPSTKINFSIPEPGFVNLKIYNSIGEEIGTLLNEDKSAGTYEVDFVAEGLTSGIYFYSITTGNFIQTKKMILMK